MYIYLFLDNYMYMYMFGVPVACPRGTGPAEDHLRLAGRATDDDTATIIWKTQLRRSLTLEGGSQPPISIEMQQQRRTRTTDGPTTMHRIAAPK